MECHKETFPGTEEYLLAFRTKAVRLQVPLAGSFELTHRCNLRCQHCYLSGTHMEEKLRKSEMSTSRVLSFISEIADAGCMDLLITGGEPLLRKDFPDIYRHARECGLLVTVFTNGTLITDSLVKLFRELPPHQVEISLYGATGQTYENITRVKGSHELCMAGIRKLVENSVKTGLKTVLMTLNMDELSAMEDIAKKFGTNFRVDPALFPRFNGEKNPVDLRVSPEQVISWEFSDYKRADSWKKQSESPRQISRQSSLYDCGAGVYSFHAGPYGSIQPCLMIDDMAYDLSAGGFRDGWLSITREIKGKKATPQFRCGSCEKKHLCGFCPAFFRLETGSAETVSPYLCELGERRSKMLGELTEKEAL